MDVGSVISFYPAMFWGAVDVVTEVLHAIWTAFRAKPIEIANANLYQTPPVGEVTLGL